LNIFSDTQLLPINRNLRHRSSSKAHGGVTATTPRVPFIVAILRQAKALPENTALAQ
jgi:hypothetical protein